MQNAALYSEGWRVCAAGTATPWARPQRWRARAPRVLGGHYATNERRGRHARERLHGNIAP